MTKGKSDPVWFVSEILGVKLFPAQEQIMREFYQNRYNPSLTPYKQLILVAGMRSGKTALASIMSCYEFFCALSLPSISEHYGLLRDQAVFISVISTSEKQADQGVYANMQVMIENCEWMNQWFDITVGNEIIACEDKHIGMQTLSSWSNTAVGRSNLCVIFDELANFEDTQGKRGAWEIWSRLIKSTDTFHDDGHVIGISSPRRPDDIIMTLLKRGMECRQLKGDKCRILSYKKPTWEMNPNLTEKGLREEHVKDLGTFYRDYACQPEMWSGIQFPEGVFLKPIVNVLKAQNYKTDDIHIIAIDPAAKNDSFGVASGYKARDGQTIVDGVLKFRRETGEAYIKPSEIYDYLASAINTLHATHLIYDVWMFVDTMDRLRDRFGIELIKHNVGKEDYDRWRDMQNNPATPLTVVFDDDLKMEAEALTVTDRDRPRVDHPATGSKDMADCVANVIWFLNGMEPATPPSLNMTYMRVI